MTTSAAPRPRRRAPWADARFVLGILLIVASVAGVWLVVSASRQTAPVLAAARTIVPGEVLSAGDLVPVDVMLGSAGDAYLSPDALDDGMVATRTIAGGELVPSSAVGDADATRTTTVVVRSAVEVPAAVAAGATVELWSAPLLERGRYDVPSILVADATVVSVDRDDSMIGGAPSSLELVIPRADVADVLAATASEAALSVVPTGGTTR